jgi:hypothetical protein
MREEEFEHEVIMSPKEYDRSGRNVRVPEDELISIVLDRIDAYASLHERERRNYPNPTASPIVTRITSGKTIEIPQKIVDKAIEIHKEGVCEQMKSVSKSNGNSKRGEHSEMSAAHTRLSKRDRYSDADPFILDQDLRGLELTGHDGEVAGDATFRDYPQRYKDFNKRMNKHMDSTEMSSDLQDRANPYNSNSHRSYNATEQRNKASVGNFRSGTLPHSSGPGNGGKGGKGVENGADYMDDVTGVHSDISPESGSASVYAPLDEDMNFDSNNQKYGSANSGPDIGSDPRPMDTENYNDVPDYNCESCGHNDGYRSNDPYDRDTHEHEFKDGGYQDHYDGGDYDGGDYDGCDYDESDYDEQYYPEFEDDYDDDGENKELVEAYDNSSSSGYNNTALYLLFFILIAGVVMYYREKNKGGVMGNGNVTGISQFW